MREQFIKIRVSRDERDKAAKVAESRGVSISEVLRKHIERLAKADEKRAGG